MRHALFTLVLFGCYSPNLRDGQFTCEHSAACPDGFECVCHQCKKSGTAGSSSCMVDGGEDLSSSVNPDLSSRSDLSMPPDLRPATLGGCSSGARSTIDPGRAKVAFCPGAWAIAGLTTNTPCNRVVGTNGRTGGVACSSEDNCASGWHVCTSESDATTAGLTSDDCINAGSESALWVTRQLGAPPTPPATGPPECSGSMAGPVFGCGGWGMAPDSTSCHLWKRVLVNGAGGGSDMCSSATSGVFSCGTAAGAELNDVVKTTRDTGGGVLCCSN